MAEEPPYLSVDTDVSAKYKGAFCEAKIRKVVRSVKCKVLFKQGWGSATVPDDQIRGALRIGAVVEAKHPDKKEFAEATITKIQDCSQYTVVFDDGDITTLRRTALCLKSGRHFAESDTLDQLPLTHPEHFSNPVIGGRRGRRRLDENSEDEELLLITGGELEDEREEHIGRVVCVEGSEKKKQKDNWFPGLVVAPTVQDNVPIHVKEEYLVRSFKDGRYYTVPKKEANEFTREVGARAEHPTLKAAVDKALLYLDRDELPPHWDRDLLLFGLGDVTSTDNDGGADYESSDDEPREEKDHFVAQLYKFMDDSGTPINKGPTIGTRDVDLYKLFKVVQNQGGYNRVTNHNNWKLVALKMGFGQNPITVNLVKLAYKKFLFTFEEFYRKLGCTLLNHPSRLSRSCCRGGRNLIRNKDQSNSSTSTLKNDGKLRQVKDNKVGTSEMAVPVSKIKVEKVEEYITTQTEDDGVEEMQIEITKSPSPPLTQRERLKRTHTSPNPPANPVKLPLPIKIKLEPGSSSSSLTPISSSSTTPVPVPVTNSSEIIAPSTSAGNNTATPAATTSSITTTLPSTSSSSSAAAAVSSTSSPSTATSTVVISTGGDGDAVTTTVAAVVSTTATAITTISSSTTISQSLTTNIQQTSPLTSSNISSLQLTSTSHVNQNFLQINQTNQPITLQLLDQQTPSLQITSNQKKEPRARQIKKIQSNSISNLCNNSSTTSTTNLQNTKESENLTLEEAACIEQPPQLKEKKRRAAFPRAVVAAKKVKQQNSSRVTSPHPPGLAASRTKRTVNKDKLRTIVKNLKSKWVPTAITPSTNTQEQSSTSNKNAVKSKAKDDSNTINIRSKKDESNTQNNVGTDDKKKGGRKRRDKRLSEDRFVPLPSYKTILLGDKLRVYYGPTLESKVTYEAKVLSIRTEGNESVYLVHYTGWNNRYDEWIKTSRIADNLSWIPGRTARKPNQTPKTPKKKGAHNKNEANIAGKDATSTTNSNTISGSKNSGQCLTTNSTRKTSTRASTRAAAIKKEIPESTQDYESDATEIDSNVATKKMIDNDSSKTNENNDIKKKRKKKILDEIKVEVTEIKIETEDFEEGDVDDEEHDHLEISSLSEKNIKPIIKKIEEEEENETNEITNDGNNTNNNLGNVIIVDVEVKNESEEESLMIDENAVIDEAQVIEGYSSVVESENNREEKFKVLVGQTGRDFDLTQIRSELKGIETAVTSNRTDEVIEEENVSVANTVDIYEFKEPEFETSKFDEKTKQVRRSGLVVRMFGDVRENKTSDETETENNTFSVTAGPSTDSLTDERPILKTCEEAFDRVCAEPLRAATERPPAGFLFMDEEDDEDDYDDDSQDRLIISERDSDNDIPNEVSIDFTPEQHVIITKQVPINNNDNSDTKNNQVLENDCDKSVLLSKDDEDEDLEDELLNVAIQRAIESSDDTNDGDLLTRHLAPRCMFTDTFGPIVETDGSKTQLENDTDRLLKIGILPTNREASAPTEETNKENTGRVLQNSALDLSQGTDDIQERVEVISHEEEMICEDDVITQDVAEPETVTLDTIDMETNLGVDTEDVEDEDLITVEEAPSSQHPHQQSTTIVSTSSSVSSAAVIVSAAITAPPVTTTLTTIMKVPPAATASSTIAASRGPHTPPGPAPRSPPETEQEDEFSESFEDQYDEVGRSEQLERDDAPPLLTREVEVEEVEERQEEIEANEDNDETNLVSLLCEETIPGSPTAVPVHTEERYQLSPEINEDVSFHYNEVAVTKDDDEEEDEEEDEENSSPEKEDIQQKFTNSTEFVPIEQTIQAEQQLQQHHHQHHQQQQQQQQQQLQQQSPAAFRTLPQVTQQTPIPSPTSSLSSANSPPSERVEIESPSHEQVIIPQPASTCQTEQYQESSQTSQIQQQSDDGSSKPSTSNESSLRTRKAETRNSGKKTRRTRKRSEEVNKRKYRSRHHGSESDDNCESSNRGGFQSRSHTPPRLRKYNFGVELTPEMDHQQRVNKIQNAIGEVRKAHANVKMELVSIERRRKKLRRREREYRI